MKQAWVLISLLAIVGLTGCQKQSSTPTAETEAASSETTTAAPPVTITNTPDTMERQPKEISKAPVQQAATTYNPRFAIYTPVTLNTDLSHLSASQKQMLGLLIDASKIMDELFWRQAYGDHRNLLKNVTDKPVQQFIFNNYGPWDRLDGNKPFVPGVQPKPAGANFYPADMSKEEFAAWEEPNKAGLYSFVERDENNALVLVPYSEKFKAELTQAAQLLRDAAELAEDAQFANYLRLRADALLSDEYQASDMAWMDMKNNPIELVIGPIETYEDQLFGYRAAFEAYVLVKDMEWSQRLARFAKYMPELQQGLPVPSTYKQETPGTDADLNAYDAIYYAGDCNAGSKTIAINLPNDEEVQLSKGTRRLQLKNAMRSKFDKILVPIANQLVAPEQRQYITFDAFFANTMFHEVAHGLGIKNTITGNGTVRQALKEHASALEEGKADILGLYMVQKLREKGEITEGQLMDNYVTFMAGIFRSVRFGASSAHGKANMIRFNYFQQAGAFEYDPNTRLYRVNAEKFEQAIASLSELLLTLQGDGDYAKVSAFVRDKGNISAQLQADLDRLTAANIPVDVIFNQGKKVLGL